MSLLKVITFGAIVFSQVAFGETIAYKPLNMQVQPGDQLMIQGFAGDIKFIPNERANSLSISLKQINPKKGSDKVLSLLEEWMFVMDRKDKKIRLIITGPASRRDWAPIVRQNGMPQFHLIIRGPSLPVKISWWKGEVQFNQWKSSADINLLNGSIAVQKMEGDLKLFGQAGSMKVSQHKGQILIGSYRSTVLLNEVEGDVELENFAGKSQLFKVKGAVRYKGFKGALRLSDSEGDVQFESRQAGIQLAKHQGDIKGRSAEGRVGLDLQGKVNVNVRSQAGEISLKLRGSGASVNLGSREGLIYAPSYLRTTSYPTLRVKQGRLRGREQGRVFVRTESGVIRLR